MIVCKCDGQTRRTRIARVGLARRAGANAGCEEIRVMVHIAYKVMENAI